MTVIKELKRPYRTWSAVCEPRYILEIGIKIPSKINQVNSAFFLPDAPIKSEMMIS